MPYGVSKDVGGDTPRTNKIMEECVQRYLAKGLSKEQAIRRCKAGIQRSLRKNMKG